MTPSRKLGTDSRARPEFRPHHTRQRAGRTTSKMVHAQTTQCSECAQLKKTIETLRNEIAKQRKEAQELRDSLKASHELIQAIPSAILVGQYQPPGELFCVSANPEAMKLLGVNRDYCCGVELEELWPGARDQGLIDGFLKTARTGESHFSEAAFYRFGVAKRMFRVRALWLPGNRLGIAFSDVTEEKLAEGLFDIASKELEEELRERTSSLTQRIKTLEQEVQRLRGEP